VVGYDEEKASVWSVGATLLTIKYAVQFSLMGFHPTDTPGVTEQDTRLFETLRTHQERGENGMRHVALLDPDGQGKKAWQYVSQQAAPYALWPEDSPFGALIDGMMHHDPQKRFSMDGIAEHEWLRDPSPLRDRDDAPEPTVYRNMNSRPGTQR
jgi:serine/threonine protein kinase